MKVLCLLALFIAPLAAADLKALIATVERRYNSARTMEASFEQAYVAQGRRRVERGDLWLRKPGRMRWEYTNPAGKLFIADGKWVWMYSPATGKAEKAKLKVSDDERAPLAFLLGKLDFSRLFQDFELTESGGAAVIRAQPKSDKVPYTSVEFTISGQGEIQRLKVAGGDGSVTEYTFTNQRLNGAVDDTRFRFTPPPGVSVEEITEGGGR